MAAYNGREGEREQEICRGVNAILRRGFVEMQQKWSQAVKLAAVNELGMAIRIVYHKHERVSVVRRDRSRR